jgi:hypothetical protein
MHRRSPTVNDFWQRSKLPTTRIEPGMVMIQLRLVGWRFRLEWLMVHLVAGLIIALFLSIVSWQIILVLPIMAVAGAPIVALAQASVVRRYLPQTRWWLLATWGGWLAGWLVSIPVAGFATIVLLSSGSMVSLEVGDTVLGAVALFSMGAAMGWFQWMVMKDQVPAAGRWIAISALGWALAWILGLLASEALYNLSASAGAVDFVRAALAGCVFALVSGRPLYAILRRATPISDAETVPDSPGMPA